MKYSDKPERRDLLTFLEAQPSYCSPSSWTAEAAARTAAVGEDVTEGHGVGTGPYLL